MEAIISAVGGQAPPRRNRRGLQDLIGPPQLPDLPLQRLQPLALIAGQPRAEAIIGLGPTDQLRSVSCQLPNLAAIEQIAAPARDARPGPPTPCPPPAPAAPADTSPVWSWLQPLTSRNLQETRGDSHTQPNQPAQRQTEAHIGQIFSKLGLRDAPGYHRRVLAVLTFLRTQ
jgi:hypothetical protein